MKKNTTFFANFNPLHNRKLTTSNELFIVGIFICVKILFMILLLKEGFIGLSGDDFARQLAGYAWSKEPFLFSSGWPPLQFWILGFLMKIYPNIRVANLLVNGIFSTLAIIFLYLLIRLFFEKRIALLTLAISAVLPWQLKLSISGLCEPIYHFFLITSLFYLFKWEDTQNKYTAILCAISLLFANMLRIEAWAFYLAVSIYILINLILMPKNYKNKHILLFTLLIPLSFIFIWIMLGKLQTNFEVLREDFYTATSIQSSYFLRLFRYPGYLFLISPFIALAGLAGIFSLLKTDIKLSFRYLVVPTLYFFGLIGMSVLTGADSLAAPLRLVVPFIYFLTPLSLFLFFKTNKLIYTRIGYVFFALVIAWNVFFSFNFNRNDFRDIADVSKILTKAWSAGVINKTQKVFFERNFMTPYVYDHIALRVLTNRPRNIIFNNESNSKLFLNPVPNDIINDEIGAFIACDKRAKEYFSKKYPIVTDVGVYKIFWTTHDLKQLDNKKILKSRPPEHMVNVDFGQGIKLIGYSAEHGSFPAAFTTHWELDRAIQFPITIQYGLMYKKADTNPFILSSHNLGNLEDGSVHRREHNIVDWQALILPKTTISGHYTVAIKLVQRDNKRLYTENNSDFNKWYPLTKVTLIKNKRDVLRRLVNRELDNYSLGLKVLMSLF